jgi:hypothetical protein
VTPDRISEGVGLATCALGKRVVSKVPNFLHRTKVLVFKHDSHFLQGVHGLRATKSLDG